MTGDAKLAITEAGFLTEFLNQHSQRTERPFCFILGAGVSRMSGIPTGSEMATIWLREIYEAENFDGLGLEEWATPERLEIPGFTVDALAVFILNFTGGGIPITNRRAMPSSRARWKGRNRAMAIACWPIFSRRRRTGSW